MCCKMRRDEPRPKAPLEKAGFVLGFRKDRLEPQQKQNSLRPSASLSKSRWLEPRKSCDKRIYCEGEQKN